MLREIFISIILLRVGNKVSSLNCPKNCECKGGGIGLKCHEADPSAVEEYLTSKRIKELSFTYSTISLRMWTLLYNSSNIEHLDLSSNHLSEFPRNCFKQMNKMKTLTASNNNLKSLEDGIFDGLVSLERIFLIGNNISYIGVNVFTDVNLFKNLEHIDLSSNNLKSLDTWPLALGLRGTKLTVNLGFNLISNLTNHLNFIIKCPNNQSVQLLLNDNKLTHLAQFFMSWAPTTDFVHTKCSYDSFKGIQTYGNKLACDCIDYAVLTFKQRAYHAKIFVDMPCRVGKAGASIDPPSIICAVTEDCPENCTCYQRPYNNTLVVDCSRLVKLDTFPTKLPSRKTMTYFYSIPLRYDLIFTHHSIDRITENSVLLKYTKSLDLSSGILTTIEPAALKFMRNVERILLNNNKLTSLPKEILNANLTTKQWSLHDNPWACNCDNKWMKTWFTMNHDKLNRKPFCSSPEWHSGKHIMEVDFCYKPLSNHKLLFEIITAILISLVFLTSITLLSWRKNKHLIFEKYGIRFIWDNDECLSERMLHDVFLVCSHANIEDGLKVLGILENYHGFNVCFHERDFLVGESILDNARNAIVNSKRTLCLISKDFLSSHWCLEEFKMAYNNDLDKKKHRVLVVLLEQVDWDVEQHPEIKSYIRSRSYLELFNLPEEIAWRTLLYSMPRPKKEDHSINPSSDVELLIP